jgi:hypothetical protein
MKTIKLLSAASTAVLALGVASSGFSPSPASAQGYGAAPPPPPYEAPPYEPPASDLPKQSILKVCKIAKEIPVGTVFTFYTKPSGQKQTVMIPAGPEPGGYCQVLGVYPTGTRVGLYEYLPKGYSVVSISTNPGSAEVSQNLSEPSVQLVLPPGFTEVTIRQTGTGWIEICKDGGRRGQNYEFSFIGMNGQQTASVLAGACTPAIQVPAGNLVVNELNAQGQMIGGDTLPADRLVSADAGRSQMTVKIKVGEIQNQTLIRFRNREQKGGNY